MKQMITPKGLLDVAISFTDGSAFYNYTYAQYIHSTTGELVDKDEAELADFMNRRGLIAVSEEALRYNEGKPDWTLVHMASLIPMIQVLEYGKNKYTRENWKKPMDRNTILASAQRHLAALIDGEENDPESGLPHIGHLLANGLFYSYHYANKEIPNGVPPREEIVRGISGLG